MGDIPPSVSSWDTATWIDRWLISAAVLGVPTVVIWWKNHRAAPLEVLAGEVLHGVMWLLAAGLVAAVVWNQVSRRRGTARHGKAQVETAIRTSLLAVIGPDSGATVRVTGWERREPTTIQMALPSSWDPKALGADRKLRKALARSTGLTWGPGEYVEDHSNARFPALVTFTVSGPATADEVAREETEERVIGIISRAIAGARSVTVTAWKDGAPAAIDATFSPSPALVSEVRQHAIERVVAETFPGRWRAQWDLQNDRVSFALRPGLPTHAPRPLGLARPSKPTLRYAVDADGRLIGWPLTGTAPHALVAGPTGGGKTYLLRAMALDAIAQDIPVFACDPKRIELMGLRGVPGVREIATDPAAMAELIEDMYSLMDERYQQIERRETVTDGVERALFVIDEFFILVMRLNRLWKAMGEKGEHPAIGLVWEMLALARSARIHVAIGIQRPDAAFLDGPARDNIRHRASLTALTPDGARMMWGDVSVGVDIEAIAGRATVTGPEGKPVEAQVLAVPDPDPHLAHKWSDQDRAVLADVLGQDWVDEQLDRRRKGDVPPAAQDKPATGGTQPATADEEDFEDLLDEAANLVTTIEYASTAMLQRKLRVSHVVASDLVAALQDGGIIAEEPTESGSYPLLITAASIQERIDSATPAAAAPAAPTSGPDKPQGQPAAEPAPASATTDVADGSSPHLHSAPPASDAVQENAPTGKKKSNKSGTNRRKNIAPVAPSAPGPEESAAPAESSGCSNAPAPAASERTSADLPKAEPRRVPCSVDHLSTGDRIRIDGADCVLVGVEEDPEDDSFLMLELERKGQVEVVSMDAFATVMREA